MSLCPLPGQALPSHERLLFEHAQELAENGVYDQDALCKLTHTHGLDLATAFAYLHAEQRARPLLNRVGAWQRAVVASGRVLIVPGGFHRHHSHTGADGARLVRLATELGIPVELVQIPSFAPASTNAPIVAEHLRRINEPTVLITISKGAADVRRLCEQQGSGPFGDVVTWLDLSGMSEGTPLVQWLESRPLRQAGMKALMALQRLPFEAVRELRDDGPFSPGWSPPVGVRRLRVLGFPLISHTSHIWATRAIERVRDLGPSDGGGILLGRALSGSCPILPIWGADHFLSPSWNLDRTLRALIALSFDPMFL